MTVELAEEVVQLFLVTPPEIDLAHFPVLLAEALSAAPVSCVLIASGRTEDERQALADPLIPIIQDAGAAALILDHTRVAGRIGADGVQISTGRQDTDAAIRSFRPKRIVGAAGPGTRHAAMELGEVEPDYLFFGKPHGDTFADPHPRALELAEWWSDLMQIPAVLMAGNSLDSVRACAQTGISFVALHRAVWEHPGGPGEAVTIAARLLARAGEPVP